MPKSLSTIITAAAHRGPSLTAGIINRLSEVTADYHRTYARDIAACLYRGLELPVSGERGPHYFTALHGLTIAVAALNPAEIEPWGVAIRLHTVGNPSFVCLDRPGADLLSAIGDADDDTLTVAAVKRTVEALARFARMYQGGDLGQKHVSYKMLVTALSVLNTDEHVLARRLMDTAPVQ